MYKLIQTSGWIKWTHSSYTSTSHNLSIWGLQFSIYQLFLLYWFSLLIIWVISQWSNQSIWNEYRHLGLVISITLKCNLQWQISTLENSKGNFATNIFHTFHSWAIQHVWQLKCLVGHPIHSRMPWIGKQAPSSIVSSCVSWFQFNFSCHLYAWSMTTNFFFKYKYEITQIISLKFCIYMKLLFN